MAKITQTASGNYICRVYIGQTSDGKKKYKQLSHNNKRILQSMIAEYELTHKGKLNSDTFSSCLERYIFQRKDIISPSTYRVYKSAQSVLTEKYPSFCALPIYDIGRNDIQRIINDMIRRKLSGKYIKNIHGIISGVLLENDYPSPKVSLPSAKARNEYEPTKEDIHATLEAARGTDMEIPILLGIHGLRRGEICALRYPDDFNGKIIHVRHALVYGYKDEVIEKDTKTEDSDRFVPLSDECYQKIVEQGYVTHKTLAAISHAFVRLLNKNDIPKYRFHDLRHFFASYLHEQGFSDAQIMKLGGWKTDNVMKRVYRYALKDEKVSDRINDIFSKI